jgi:hypothetical protein
MRSEFLPLAAETRGTRAAGRLIKEDVWAGGWEMRWEAAGADAREEDLERLAAPACDGLLGMLES